MTTAYKIMPNTSWWERRESEPWPLRSGISAGWALLHRAILKVSILEHHECHHTRDSRRSAKPSFLDRLTMTVCCAASEWTLLLKQLWKKKKKLWRALFEPHTNYLKAIRELEDEFNLFRTICKIHYLISLSNWKYKGDSIFKTFQIFALP